MDVWETVTVIELASVLAGPSVGQFFAELGARVIKIENPKTGGDTTRSWLAAGEEPPVPACTAYFASVNWGKESIGVDMQTAEGKQIVHQLVADADIVVTSYKPGAAQRLQVDYPTLQAINESLIYVSITGFGEEEERLGFDALVQGETGYMVMNGWPGQGPTKMPVALMDVLAGHQAKEGVLVALLERNTTGRGQCIEVSLRDAALAGLVNQGTNWLQAGLDPRPIGNDHPNIVPYGTLFTDKDGQSFMLAIGIDGQFKSLCDIIEKPHWATDPRFSTNAMRVRHKDELVSQLQTVFKTLSVEQIYKAAFAEGVPMGKISSVAEALSDTSAAPMIYRSEYGVAGIRSNAFRATKTISAPPLLGEHTDQLLLAFGYSTAECERWRKQGVIC